MRFLLASIVLFLGFAATAQINIADSSAQVNAFWYKGEVITYKVFYHQFALLGNDTVVNDRVHYNIDVAVVDSTADSYTVEWIFRNQKDGKKILLKTTQSGVFKEIVKGDKRSNEPIPDEIVQFYMFYGKRFAMHQPMGDKTISYGVSQTPINADRAMGATEINAEYDDVTVYASILLDRKQVGDVTYENMRKQAKEMNVALPPRDQLPEMSVEEQVVNRIHGESGWLTYSELSRETFNGLTLSHVEIRRIEILE